MPWEISETGVHIAVGNPAATPPPGSAASGAGGEALTPARRESIVQACVRRVLQSLRIMKAR